MSTTRRILIEVDVDSDGERALTDWLRRWRRKGVYREGKWTYPLQGAVKAAEFRAPSAAAAELAELLNVTRCGKVRGIDE